LFFQPGKGFKKLVKNPLQINLVFITYRLGQFSRITTFRGGWFRAMVAKFKNRGREFMAEEKKRTN